jgi:hypothetical protein
MRVFRREGTNAMSDSKLLDTVGYVLAVGTPFSDGGISLYGLFRDGETATEYADDVFHGEHWEIIPVSSVTPLHDPDQYFDYNEVTSNEVIVEED